MGGVWVPGRRLLYSPGGNWWWPRGDLDNSPRRTPREQRGLEQLPALRWIAGQTLKSGPGGRSEVMSSEGTAPGKSETFGEDSAMASERLAVRAGAQERRGLADGGRAARSVGPPRDSCCLRRRGIRAPVSSPRACRAPRGHGGRQEPFWLVRTGGLWASESYRELGERPSQAGGGAQTPREVATAARRGHGLRGRGSTAQGRR